MERRSKIILALFAAVLLGIIITELARPKPINWSASYTASDKIPFGCYVLYQELPNLFPGINMERIDQTPYRTILEKESPGSASYIFINNSLDFDEQETHQLLQFVSEGNDVFMSATFFGYSLADTLNINVTSNYAVQRDTMMASFTNSRFKGEAYPYDRGHFKTRFTSVDTLNTTVLGHIEFSEPGLVNQALKEPNFIRVSFGQGHFYMHTTPQAFTNYYMLNHNQRYVANTLSYLSSHTLFWDNYKKAGRVIIDSPMRFVLNQPALKWAYYLTILGLLIFVIFKAKREQRIIPVIPPLANSSVDFAKTIGGLYYQHRDYTDLVFKKLKYFLEYIRSHYYLNIATISDKTADELASKSGKSVSETKAILDFIIYLKNKKTHSEQDVVALSKKIATFKQ